MAATPVLFLIVPHSDVPSLDGQYKHAVRVSSTSKDLSA
eukprot:SAG22_NODE_23022_length_175_cov_91.513158_1_plen_38_part_01